MREFFTVVMLALVAWCAGLWGHVLYVAYKNSASRERLWDDEMDMPLETEAED